MSVICPHGRRFGSRRHFGSSFTSRIDARIDREARTAKAPPDQGQQKAMKAK